MEDELQRKKTKGYERLWNYQTDPKHLSATGTSEQCNVATIYQIQSG